MVRRSGHNSALRFRYSPGTSDFDPPNDSPMAPWKPSYSTRLAVPFWLQTPATNSGCNTAKVSAAVPPIEPPATNTRPTFRRRFSSPMICTTSASAFGPIHEVVPR